MKFSFVTIGEHLGTRQKGEQVRSLLLEKIANCDKVVLDFTGVQVVSNSFADECFGKLLQSMSLDELKQKTTFVGLSDFARKNIAVAIRRRLVMA